MSPELLVGFAGVLGVPAGDLAALGGVRLPDDLPPHLHAADVVAVIWEARRLTTTQLDDVPATGGTLTADRRPVGLTVRHITPPPAALAPSPLRAMLIISSEKI
ncbi:hypothetical protein [Kitasatospora sp. NPDC004289]